MSLADLTRNCFQSGISASKWLDLCRLLISKDPAINTPDSIENNITNSVLTLYRLYPGDPELHEYLKYAIQQGSISLATFVAVFLQVARAHDMHVPATLDNLCRIALDAHYSSGLHPMGSVVRYGESPVAILDTVQDALALLRTAYSLPVSQFHQLTTSASELVVLLLSCVSDISQISTTHATVCSADARDLVNHFTLPPDVREVLDNFARSLDCIAGDEHKAAREAQVMHTMQLALGNGDVLSPGSETDIISLSLLLQHLVCRRAHELGSGDSVNAVALLVGAFRWSSWSPAVFYSQLFIAGFTCLAHASTTSQLWSAFLLGRLPVLLVSFEKAIKADTTTSLDWKAAIRSGVAALFRRPDILTSGDHVLGRSRASKDEETYPPASRQFLQQLIKFELLAPDSAVQLDPLLSNDRIPRLQAEAQDAGLELGPFLEAKLVPDTVLDDMIDRVWREVGTHNTFAKVIHKRFTLHARALDVEHLSFLCKILYTYETALNILSLHIKLSDLVFYALLFLEQYDCETVGDPQTAFGHLGDIVLFVQYVLAHFQFGTEQFTIENQSLSSRFLKITDVVYSHENLTVEEIACFNAWFKALFDSSSEGIEDTILRSTQPRMLLRISATLFSNAIRACSAQKIDGDVLNNGVSYFTGSLLNWTLVGVVKALVREALQRGSPSPIHMETLQALLLSPSCPRPVLALCSPQVTTLLLKISKWKSSKLTFDALALQRVVYDAAGVKHTGIGADESLNPQLCLDQPRQLIQEAFTLARSHKAPLLDLERCLKVTSPSKFLGLLWSEIVVSASLGETEICKRVATFVLTMPRSTNAPPLLPIFLYLVLPSLITVMDHQQPPELGINVELLVKVISSALTAALQLEWAMQSVSGDNRFALGQSSAAMARRLAKELRSRNNSPTSTKIAQRLASSQSLVANFPVFINELGI